MKTILFMCLIVCAVILSACGGPADISAYENDPILIVGLLDEDFKITPREIAELDSVSRSAAFTTRRVGTVEATGPLLDTFLAQYGYVPSDFDRIRFFARDDYRIVLRGDHLLYYEIVMAVSAGREPLADEYQPLRLLIPGAESYMWIFAIDRIEFLREAPVR